MKSGTTAVHNQQASNTALLPNQEQPDAAQWNRLPGPFSQQLLVLTNRFG